MIEIYRKNSIEKWFAVKIENKDAAKMVLYYQAPKKHPLFIAKPFYTLHIDLYSNFFDDFAKKTKYEIGRAQREGVLCKKLENLTIKEYLLYYNAFSKVKNLTLLDERSLGYYWDNMSIWAAYKGDLQLVVHSYLCDEKRIRLFHSISLFRVHDLPKNFVGWANRLLHYEVMRDAQGRGIAIYDVGGLTTLDEKNMNGIDRFKMGFGGSKVTEYTLYSPILWSALRLKGIYDKVSHQAR